MLLFYPDGTEVPVLFTATPNASVDDGVLINLFMQTDDLSISEHAIDQKGKEYYPFVCLNQYISRIGEQFMKYANDPNIHLGTGLGVPYGTRVY